jgi:hypothetical protein
MLRNCFFFQPHKPKVNRVYILNVFSQHGLVSVFNDYTLVVAVSHVLDDLKKFTNLGVHYAQVANESDFLDVQRTFLYQTMTVFGIHLSSRPWQAS